MNEMLEGEHLVGGSGCDVVAVPSANKTNKMNPMSCLQASRGGCV